MRFLRRTVSSLMNDTFGTRTKRNPFRVYRDFNIGSQGCHASRSNPGLGLANAFGVELVSVVEVSKPFGVELVSVVEVSKPFGVELVSVVEVSKPFGVELVSVVEVSKPFGVEPDSERGLML